MSTTEALRTQLDALRSQLYALEAQNRKLRDERPERAELVDIEEELKQTQAESVRLSQRISELGQAQEASQGASGTPSPEAGQLREDLTRLGEETAALSRRAGGTESALRRTVCGARRGERSA